MKVIYNKVIPFKGFKCINLFGVLFAREGAKLSEVTYTHEYIHTKQMKEMLYIPFYILYVLEWLVRLVIMHNAKQAYSRISFEMEAYYNQYNSSYPDTRQHFTWLKYL